MENSSKYEIINNDSLNFFYRQLIIYTIKPVNSLKLFLEYNITLYKN